MTRAPPENISVLEADASISPGTGGHQSPSQLTPAQSPQGASNFVDGSGPIFSMYMKMASEEDKKMAENWKEDADGILIFTGLFSAAVASLISVSIQDIRPNPQDASNFYLANIYQAVADPNRIGIPSSLPSSPPTFSPPKSAVWVNALWFLSLVISLTCALLATLLQQWARRYLKVTQLRCGLHKQARIRAFFAEGVDKFLLPWAVEALPTLLHVSLFLFFAGLAVFLSTVNLTIFKLVLTWACGCTVFYGCITIMPIFRHDSPYHTPLLLAAWHIVTGTGFVAFRALRRLACDGSAAYYLERWEESCRRLVTQGMQGTTEETALNSSSEINTRVFMWTFDSLDEDHELERFFSGLPGFRSSEVVNDPLPRLTRAERNRLSTALMGLFDRTFSSHLLSDRVKQRRAIICAKAIDPGYTPRAVTIIDKILSDHQLSSLFSEIVRTVRCWGENSHRDISAFAEVTVFGILAIAPQRDDSWFILASNELGVPESVVRGYANEGDSLSLAILIHITRQQFTHFRMSSTSSWISTRFSKVLNEASKFNVQNTLPELQHEFCALWNQIVLKVQNNKDPTIMMPDSVLAPIRNHYLALHQGTNAAPTIFSATTDDQDWILSDPASYPLCDIPGHHPDSSPYTHDVSSSTTLACATPPHNNAALAPTPPAVPDVPSSSGPAPFRVDESPITSPDPVTGAVREIVASGMTVPRPTPSTSTSALLLPSTPGPTAVSSQQNPDPQTPSGSPNFPSSASSNPVPDKILPTGPPLSSNSPMTRFDLSPSRPEPHRSIIIATAPGAPPGPTPALDLGAAAEGDSSPKLRKEMDALGSPTSNRGIHGNTRATLELRPLSPSLPPVTDPDVAIACPSLRGPNAEHTRDCPPRPSHCTYDMV